jgi:hypothetical protein
MFETLKEVGDYFVNWEWNRKKEITPWIKTEHVIDYFLSGFILGLIELIVGEIRGKKRAIIGYKIQTVTIR